MNRISVNASGCYDVCIGAGLLQRLGAMMQPLVKGKTVAIVSDDNVWPLYGQTVENNLENAGFGPVYHFVIPAGEERKNGSTYLQLLSFLAQHQLTRSDCILALGGGVVGDLAGFTAATYLRGIAYVQVPTTLLAAVDSSVGGKTAIDLPEGKNLAGAFYQPALVVCDTNTLQTLPEDIFRDGCAEVIKYGILYDEALFTHLAEKGLDFHREQVITRCVELKRDVVMEDEFDTGARMRLNLGHTIGHGVEAQSNFTLSHGKAVAIGTAIVSRAGAACGICNESTCDAILSVLEKFGLPCRTIYPAAEIYSCTLSDKKRSGGTINLIIPQRIGYCAICPTPISELQEFIEVGL
jgi:3-dehydroquinate synthase